MRPVFFYKPSLQSSHDVDHWRWWLKVWLPVAIAIAVICTESTDTFSAQNTSSWLRPIMERWFGAFSDVRWESFHHYLRKTGHFVGYGTVGFTFLRAWLHTIARRGISSLLSWRLESSILAILSTAIVASGDEFHHSFPAEPELRSTCCSTLVERPPCVCSSGSSAGAGARLRNCRYEVSQPPVPRSECHRVETVPL
jgi:hypothetical protein